MSLYVAAKLLASLVTGMLGIPFGMLPSILLYRGLANGLDGSDEAKLRYARTLWVGMILGWILASLASWYIITALFG